MKRTAYWIHEKREDPTSVNGFIYETACKCSACGYFTNLEKKVCPNCGAKMTAAPVKQG
jgi:hypothetical protein